MSEWSAYHYAASQDDEMKVHPDLVSTGSDNSNNGLMSDECVVVLTKIRLGYPRFNIEMSPAIE
jgi:hypothetical protein